MEITIINDTVFLPIIIVITLGVFAYLATTAKNGWLKTGLYFMTMWLVWAAANVAQVYLDSGISGATIAWVTSIHYTIYGWFALWFIFFMVNVTGIDKPKSEEDNIDG